MSLYNLLHGVDGNARIALAILSLGPDEIPRFRDAWLRPGGSEIGIRTRTGGGNRGDYREENARLVRHPLYVGDCDDEFDSTYATFSFQVPDTLRDLTARLAPKQDKAGLWEMTQAAIAGLKGPDATKAGITEEAGLKLERLILAACENERIERGDKS